MYILWFLREIADKIYNRVFWLIIGSFHFLLNGHQSYTLPIQYNRMKDFKGCLSWLDLYIFLKWFEILSGDRLCSILPGLFYEISNFPENFLTNFRFDFYDVLRMFEFMNGCSGKTKSLFSLILWCELIIEFSNKNYTEISSKLHSIVLNFPGIRAANNESYK